MKIVRTQDAQRLQQLPAAGRHLAEHNSRISIFRAQYSATLTLTAEQVSSGVAGELTIDALPVGTLSAEIASHEAAGRKMCLLSLVAEEVDGLHLPAAVVWRLALRSQRALFAAAGENWRTDVAPLAAIPIVAESRQVWRADKSGPRSTLFSEPIVFQSNHCADIGFAATDAWGFKSDVLLRDIARTMPSGARFIPLPYRYSGLISRVHSAIKLANAFNSPNALFAETLPRNAFVLAGTREGYEIDTASLNNVIDYIDTRLLPSLVVVDPRRIPLTVMPHGTRTWVEVWGQHAATRQNIAAIDTPPTDGSSLAFKCTITLVAYFVALESDAGDVPPGVQQTVDAPANPPGPDDADE